MSKKVLFVGFVGAALSVAIIVAGAMISRSDLGTPTGPEGLWKPQVSSFTELVDASEAIIEGTVVAVEERSEPDAYNKDLDTMKYLYSTVRVDRAHKGPLKEGDTFETRLFTGWPDKPFVDPAAPPFLKGERHILFLKWYPDTGFWSLSAGYQAHAEILSDGTLKPNPAIEDRHSPLAKWRGRPSKELSEAIDTVAVK